MAKSPEERRAYAKRARHGPAPKLCPHGVLGIKKCEKCVRESSRKRQTAYRNKSRTKINRRRRKNFPKYYILNRKSLMKSAKDSYRKDPIKAGERNRKRRYYVFFRLTPEDYETIKTFQSNHSKFKLLLGKGKKRDSVEHRHADGLVRGLMGALLNRAYGLIENLYPKNTSEILRTLAEFHDNPPATAALGAPRYGLIGRAKYKKKMVYGSPDGPITAPKKVGKKK